LTLFILFVCTKNQFKDVVESCALETGSHFVTQRWLGGMLTNWSTIKVCVNNLQLFCVLFFFLILFKIGVNKFNNYFCFY